MLGRTEGDGMHQWMTTTERLEAMAREAGIEPVSQIWDWTLTSFATAVANGRADRIERETAARVAKTVGSLNGRR